MTDPRASRAAQPDPFAAPPVNPRPRRRWLFAAGAGLVALSVGVAVLGLQASGATTLQIVDRGDDETVHEREVRVGEEFRLEHRHSVTRRMVYETFSVLDRDTVAIEELWFDEFGANLPAGPEEIDGEMTEFIAEDGAYRVVHDSRPLGSLLVVAGSADVDHTIEFADGEEVRFLDLVEPGAHVEVLAGDDVSGQ
ncbi:DUF1850 domain-containing protein [Egibacter rhizosphaerae]|uniref:DUF1850 domain-containing protein n=1 Tax=Egibacter rhizosphaerae TaxID=1670831 RepID=A0A411YDV6_9ACTN|nr:DUF1850 domain-containing protein [Egibacter rhizosphaerae]QBI19413.1 DUF1850 domain-containing protein [Egibacter rhizosphaerae]